ncbi:MAG TPA: AI-2E family transporter, partial [Ardenticatenaceae bacterium]|nr:AI-2E family transporter [Ardenticatenaceae bacterium]
VGAYLLYRLGETVLVLFAAIIFASAIRPYVDMLGGRGIGRGPAILICYFAILAAFVGLLIVAIPPLIGLMTELVKEGVLIERVGELSRSLYRFGWSQFSIRVPQLFTVPQQLQALMDQAEGSVRELAWPFARDAGYIVSQLFVALLMGFYWLTSRDVFLDLANRVTPLRHRERVLLVWNDIEETLGSYVRGQMILMVCIGVASYVGLLLLRVPFPLALAVVAGLTEVIPVIGPILGMIPAVMVGFTVSPTLGLLVIGLYILIQQLENNVLVPKIMERSVGLNPLVVIVALVAGSSLNGVVGALLAIPVAGALQVIAKHLLIQPAIESQKPRTEAGIVIFDTPEPEAPPAIVVPANVSATNAQS